MKTAESMTLFERAQRDCKVYEKALEEILALSTPYSDETDKDRRRYLAKIELRARRALVNTGMLSESSPSPSVHQGS